MRSKDLNISRMLVWLSLLMLAAFLIYWNLNQYNYEKNELSQDLYDQMSLAHSQVNDSLFTSIFSMVDIDSMIGDFHVQTQYQSHQIDGYSSKDLSNIDTSISISVNAVSTGFSGLDSMIRSPSSKAFSRMTQGIEHDSSDVFISFSSDMNGEKINHNWNIVAEQLGYSNQNEKVLLYFVENLKDQGLPLFFKLDSLSSVKSEKEELFSIPFKASVFAKIQQRVVFDQYRSYLFKKIFPSMLMSSFLFGFVSLAFFFISRTRKTQERLVEMKSEFISNMTHELKTPISTVGVALESLSDFGTISDPIKRQEYFDISKHELNRLNILVDKVMKMASFESGEVSLEFEEIDLRKLLEKMLKSMSLHFDKHHVNLQYDAIGDDFIIEGDQIHLINVLYNLIDNAIKYAKDEPEINITITEENASVLLNMSDSGIGIPKQYQGQIFDRFFRVPRQDVHDVKGYGIGLNYSAGVIQKHMGTIKLSSTEGIGTSFLIKLPKSR